MHCIIKAVDSLLLRFYHVVYVQITYAYSNVIVLSLACLIYNKNDSLSAHAYLSGNFFLNTRSVCSRHVILMSSLPRSLYATLPHH
jgi:hypothetical protein